LHCKHKVLKISDKEGLNKENITLDSSSKAFNDNVENIKLLKGKIEDEINKINDLYEKTISDLNKAFQEKHEKLIKQENEIKEKLQNEVTKTKERLENFLTQSNNEIKLNERINSGLKQLDKEEKNMLRILSYISKMNKNTKNMSKLSQKLMKGIKFYYDKDESTIKYEEFIFNEMPIPTNIKIKDVTIDSVNICWNIDKNMKTSKKDRATLARLWATSFACLIMNLT
jgi:exonuclease VII large subunit